MGEPTPDYCDTHGPYIQRDDGSCPECRIDELEAQIGYVRNCRDRLRREYTALEDGLRKLAETVETSIGFLTDRDCLGYIRALLGKEKDDG